MAALVPLAGGGDKGAMALAPILRGIADLALPPRCPSCGAVTVAAHRFCAECWGALTFLGLPWCAGCAVPFDHDRGEGALCGACLAEPPVHRGVRAAVAYGAVARRTVLKLKYGGRMAHADTIARLMLRLMPDDAELLVPVPLHRWRMWSRGFNQAALMAVALSRHRALPVACEALVRHKATPILKGLGADQRARAVASAFAVVPAHGPTIAGKAVVLVDDVHTSGATATACARVLLAAGAGSVTILCWARVLPGARD